MVARSGTELGYKLKYHKMTQYFNFENIGSTVVLRLAQGASSHFSEGKAAKRKWFRFTAVVATLVNAYRVCTAGFHHNPVNAAVQLIWHIFCCTEHYESEQPCGKRLVLANQTERGEHCRSECVDLWVACGNTVMFTCLSLQLWTIVAEAALSLLELTLASKWLKQATVLQTPRRSGSWAFVVRSL